MFKICNLYNGLYLRSSGGARWTKKGTTWQRFSDIKKFLLTAVAVKERQEQYLAAVRKAKTVDDLNKTVGLFGWRIIRMNYVPNDLDYDPNDPDYDPEEDFKTGGYDSSTTWSEGDDNE